jgi:geranylgeranyl pyrophosphate synthase
MSEPDLGSFLATCQARVNNALEAWLPASDICPARLHEAMRYVALGGGKRIRPTLVYATGQALGLIPNSLHGAACAVELIHSYSLVHDDLPAMDDDDLRRGRATCHKAFDEATAILVGDALQSLAFQVLASEADLPGGPAARIAMIDTLARASGSRGMAGGQALDLTAEGHELDLAMLENIHIHKTGALIRASVRLATLACTDIDEDAADRLDRYAKCLGLAFQIRDDILDVEGETAVIGKTRGKDQAQEKATYSALLGLAGAREAAATLINDALDSLGIFDQRADPLRWIADYMVRRES